MSREVVFKKERLVFKESIEKLLMHFLLKFHVSLVQVPVGLFMFVIHCTTVISLCCLKSRITQCSTIFVVKFITLSSSVFMNK